MYLPFQALRLLQPVDGQLHPLIPVLLPTMMVWMAGIQAFAVHASMEGIGGNLNVGRSFGETIRRLWLVTSASLLALGLIAAGLFAFVLPGVWLMARLIFLPAVVMNEGLGGWEAVARSWRLTTGNLLRSLAVIAIVVIPFAMTGVVAMALIGEGPVLDAAAVIIASAGLTAFSAAVAVVYSSLAASGASKSA